MAKVNAPEKMRNREGLHDYDIQWNWSTKPSASGFTAVLRVKNEAQSLPWVLPELLRSVERVIVVDNASTDDTQQVAHGVAEEAGLGERLEVLSYPFAVSRCGPEHLGTYPDSVHSLTYFYNWSFSHVRTRHALKWDGDMVLTARGGRVLRDLAWQLEGTDGTVKIRRSPVYVQSERVAYVDLARMPGELWGWSNTPGHKFIKAFDWEFVKPWAENLIQIPDWSCFELKWLDRDLFGHWSSTDFQENRHHRKMREWEVARALLDDTELPEGILRVESPEGEPVIEHLRRNYVALSRYGTNGSEPDALVEDESPSTVDGFGDGLARPPVSSAAPQSKKDEEIPYE